VDGETHRQFIAVLFFGAPVRVVQDGQIKVDEIIAQARAAGAQVTNPPADRAWGGYSAHFQDPDGHLWEIAWNPDPKFAIG